MTAVIEFPLNRVRPVAGLRPEFSAEVIIFPGVRVERLNCDLPERKPAIWTSAQQAAHATEFDFY
jgi:hypothetical protein